jgi:hypothetical protein
VQPAWYNTAVSARQEVLNTELARLLCQHGLVALPEQRLKQGVMPDLLLPFRGFYLVIEAEVDDQPQAQEQAWRKAVERVEQGLAHLALALVYPAAAGVARQPARRRAPRDPAAL